MSDLHQPEDVAAENDNSLQELAWAIQMYQGQFALILVRCNYGFLRERMVQRLREICLVEIQELTLDESTETLYTSILAAVKEQQPSALMVFGLESAIAIDRVLTSANLVRDEFAKKLTFPLLLWVNDDILRKLIRLAPDFKSWATTCEFAIASDELSDFLRQTTECIFAEVLNSGASLFQTNATILGSRYRLELESALIDLGSGKLVLEPLLEASLQFVLGRDDYASDRIDAAIDHYQQSLAFWQQSNNLERQAVVLFHRGLCDYRKADLDRAESRHHWEEAKSYFQRCVDIFESQGRINQVAKFISQQGLVLQQLEAWDELKTLAQKSLPLHQQYGSFVELAQDYGFLAEVAWHHDRWEEAKKLADKALRVLAKAPESQRQHRSLYVLLLAESHHKLGQLLEAVNNLETVRQESNPQYEPQLYIRILKALSQLYFEQGQYLEAFKIKQEQRSIEQQYGFRAFIGADRLQSRRQAINPLVAQVDTQETAAKNLDAYGRQQDVARLLTRIEIPRYKLTVIYGQSGVGKSSMVDAVLVPALEVRTIETRKVLPVILRIYTNWIVGLGQNLAEQLEKIRHQILPSVPDSTHLILEQLEQNAKHNLLTVLVFDQFEEFFFACTEQAQKLRFWNFLQNCFNIPFLKIVMSLREDYVYHLLECDRFTNLEAIGNDIFSKDIRYYIGNFSPEDAKSVINNLIKGSQVYLEPALIDELVQDLAKELDSVRPIELQVVGAQLQEEGITTLEQYKKLGDNPKAKLVQRFLAQVVKDCGPENERAARLVLYLLTDEKGTRPLKTRAELAANLAILAAELAVEAEKLDLVLQIFVKSRLVFLLPEVPTERYQLVHDYLASLIRQEQKPEVDKLTAELAREREQRKLSEQKLTRLLKQRLREARIAGVVLVTLVVLVLGFWLQAEHNKQQAQIAKIEALNSASAALLASNNQLKALVASVKAGKQLSEAKVQPELKNQVVEILEKLVVYDFQEHNHLQGHEDIVNSVSFSPDGLLLVSCSSDKTIKLWKSDGTLDRTFEKDSSRVHTVSFSPDSHLLASVNDDGYIKLWRLDGTVQRTFNGQSGLVNGLSFSPDGQILATAGKDSTIKLWRLDGTLIQTLKRHRDGVSSVSFSPDGQILASASGDSTIKLWRWRDATLLKTINGHKDGVNSVRFSLDGQFLASAGEDKIIKLWRRDGTLFKTLEGHTNEVYWLTFSPNGQFLATAGKDNTIKLWDWRNNGSLLQTFQGHRDFVSTLSFSRDGKTLASSGGDDIVKLWRFDSTFLQTLYGHEDWVYSVSFSPDGQILASASRDKTVKLWRRDGSLLNTLTGHGKEVNSVRFSRDGQTIASASNDKTIKLWGRDGTLLKTLKHSAPVNSVSFSPDGQTIAAASDDKTINLWPRDGSWLKSWQAHDNPVLGLSFSPDGQILASASADTTVKLWRRDGTLLHILRGHDGPVNSVSFSPDGQILASASNDTTVKLWQRDGTFRNTLLAHDARVSHVSFSPDGQTIASASYDKTIKLWRRDGTLLHILRGHNGRVSHVSFSPDGQTIASASEDNTVILWNWQIFQNLDLDQLLAHGCNRLQDYLKTNHNEDRHLCDGIVK